MEDAAQRVDEPEQRPEHGACDAGEERERREVAEQVCCVMCRPKERSGVEVDRETSAASRKTIPSAKSATRQSGGAAPRSRSVDTRFAYSAASSSTGATDRLERPGAHANRV